ncbi:hypothetical protein BGW39_006269 [Mortierella sp. 14UC]|nr:hypothetical protein BGW39_006269 [Mortierella sp. 14UC]
MTINQGPPTPTIEQTSTPISRSNLAREKVFSVCEIAYHIFSFVDNDTLLYSVLLVSRQWFLLGRFCAVRQLDWQERLGIVKLERALQKFPWVGRLVWYSGYGGKDGKAHKAQWKRLMAAFREREQLVTRHEKMRRLAAAAAAGSGRYLHRLCGLQEQQEQEQEQARQDEQGQHISFPYPPLLELELNGFIGAPKMFNNIFRFLSHLTRLAIRPNNGILINMRTLLSSCPLLQVLVLSQSTLGPHDYSWLADEMERQPLLRLQQLDLLQAHFHQPRLEELLYFTPRLCDLKLEGLASYPSGGGRVRVHYNGPSLAKRIKDLGLPLHSFYFSLAELNGGVPTAKNNDGLPVLKEWTEWSSDLWSSDLCSFLNTVTFQTNVVTTMDWSHREPVTLPWASALAKFLAASPQLLHLRAPRPAIPIVNLSVNRGILPMAWQEAERTPAAIWACRGLLTLYIGFHGEGQGDFSQENCTRVLFGYIARVCPLLRDLQIDAWESPRLSRPIYLRLKSGFCLLSKLKHLESLRIGPLLRTATFLEGDLDWMVPAGHTKERRENRYPVADVWEFELRTEMLEEEKRRGTGIPSREISDGVDLDRRITMSSEMATALGRLGRLMDVRQVLEEMDA